MSRSAIAGEFETRPYRRLGRLLLEQAVIPAFYRLTTFLMALVLSIFGDWQVRGRQRVPATGPLIVVANHLSLADPPLLGASLPRRVRFMAKEELFQSRLGGVWIRLFGAFPVRRFQADLKALRNAQRLLQDGQVLGMFPEGHRGSGRALQPAHPGTALLALRSGCPVLPVGITGTERIRSLRVLLEHPRITVTVGAPFTLPAPERLNAQAVQQGSDQIMRAIAALLPGSYGGGYTRGEEH